MISDHQLAIGSERCVLAGMLAKPLSPARPTADAVADMQRQQVADMLYNSDWQASAVVNASAPAAPWMKGVGRSNVGVAPLGVRLRASLSPVRTALAALPLAAASAAANDHDAFSLTATVGHNSSPCSLRSSATTFAQPGVLAAVAKTLGLEATAVRVSSQLSDPHAASNVPGTTSQGPRLQLGAAHGRYGRSDEHGVLVSGGAGYQPALTQLRDGPMQGSPPQQNSSWHGAIMVTGRPHISDVCSSTLKCAGVVWFGPKPYSHLCLGSICSDEQTFTKLMQ
jgi:hypothetical protein